ncbi:hypothetical protein SAMN02745823_00417 [Sporobacter termitidis DSM 10068]|uniref:Glycosyltransferase, GT2 family n=1 Tax=Sporobacter termitidis DSM 10068 TaxID=1123282 RepID=A0A1M5U9Q7_9FIRM|nr:hypothetical protein [Sporobacter termitidis]SHH59660.1 hypothetical protein SAMN02745823_00417 [Sporobacter termitidis DSM 10068]
MRLIHTLLFLLRANRLEEDLKLADACLRSLEKSAYNTVVVYNQGFYSNDQLRDYLSEYNLETIVLGEGVNAGTSAGRQSCFRYIWEHRPDTEFISEIHLDMIFSGNWEDKLIDYLAANDESMISCGIVDQKGNMPFAGKSTAMPAGGQITDDFLHSLQEDRIIRGFTNPCIHVSEVLKETGGYDTHFLRGKQCFEDDSMLLGYYYYYGTRAAWHPKINLNAVVYHAVAGQRLGVYDDTLVNFNGLVKQYGAMGLKHLSGLHESQWHRWFFLKKYTDIIG